MNDLKPQYKALADEVSDFKFKLENSEYFNKIKDTYKGFQILYSPLQFRPDFMFIGINPGAGYFNSTGQIVNRLLPEKTMEYVCENYDLARETKKLFKISGLSDAALSKAVKTNFYFIATKNESQLNSIIETLDPLNFEQKSKDWTKRLIQIVKPKIIICEGKSALIKVTELYNLTYKWESDIAHAKTGDCYVLGYKRRFSQIKNKEKLSGFIRKIL